MLDFKCARCKKTDRYDPQRRYRPGTEMYCERCRRSVLSQHRHDQNEHRRWVRLRTDQQTYAALKLRCGFPKAQYVKKTRRESRDRCPGASRG